MKVMHNELAINCPYCASSDVSVESVCFTPGDDQVNIPLDCGGCGKTSHLDIGIADGAVKVVLNKEDGLG
jgi:uncharacterized Zn finger protein